MEMCRICLKNRRNLRSLFDVIEGKTYAFMMTSFAKVKLEKYDETKEKICLLCCKNLIDAFKFKVLIESSDETLQNSGNTRKFYFNNLQDVKIDIEIFDENKVNLQDSNIFAYFKEGQTSISYCNTIIKKSEPSLIKIETEDLPNEECKDNFENDSEFLYDDSAINDDDDDDDYKPSNYQLRDKDYELPLYERKKQQKRDNPKKGIRKRRKNSKLKKVLITPVFMDDIKIVTAIKKDAKKVKRKYTKLLMCNYCGKMCSNLKSHLLTHSETRSYKCDTCPKTYWSAGALINHKKHHTAEKSFKCGQCFAAFIDEKSLKIHSLSHSTEKKFTCDICSKGFKRKGALNRHIRMHSLTNKCIKCDTCNMSFFSNSSLKHHVRVHTGERPYNCEICSQPYSYKHDFNRHCLKKHGVFLKRRSVFIMNEEVLKRERALMRDLMLKIQSFEKIDETLNPFEGPQAARAFEQALKDFKSKKIPLDYTC